MRIGGSELFETAARKVAAREAPHNAVWVNVDWRLEVGEARAKLARLYPVIATVAKD